MANTKSSKKNVKRNQPLSKQKAKYDKKILDSEKEERGRVYRIAA